MGRISYLQACTGVQSCVALQELQEEWCLRQPRCHLKLYSGMWRSALAAPVFKAAACCFCTPSPRSAARNRGDSEVTRSPPRPAPTEEGICGKGSYSLGKDAIPSDPSVMVQTGGVPPVSPPLLQGFVFGLDL